MVRRGRKDVWSRESVRRSSEERHKKDGLRKKVKRGMVNGASQVNSAGQDKWIKIRP